MRKVFFLLVLLTVSFCTMAQSAAPYLKSRTVPSVKLLLADSSGWELKARIDKKKPLLLVVFSPECEHCRHETAEMVKNIHRFEGIQIVMASLMPVYKNNGFVKEFGLSKYKNITVGRDYAYILPVFFGIKNLPYHAFYTKDKKLIGAFEGNMNVDRILAQFKK